MQRGCQGRTPGLEGQRLGVCRLTCTRAVVGFLSPLWWAAVADRPKRERGQAHDMQAALDGRRGLPCRMSEPRWGELQAPPHLFHHSLARPEGPRVEDHGPRAHRRGPATRMPSANGWRSVGREGPSRAVPEPVGDRDARLVRKSPHREPCTGSRRMEHDRGARQRGGQSRSRTVHPGRAAGDHGGLGSISVARTAARAYGRGEVGC